MATLSDTPLFKSVFNANYDKNFAMLKKMQDVSEHHLPQVFQFINIIMNVIGNKPKTLGVGLAVNRNAAAPDKDNTMEQDKSFANAVNNVDRQIQRRQADDAALMSQDHKKKLVPNPESVALANKMSQDKEAADELRRQQSRLHKDKLRREAEERERQRQAEDEGRKKALADENAKVGCLHARPKSWTSAGS